MKKIVQVFCITLLAIIPMILQAELYTWTDKNGKKHFGDQVPPEYADQAKPVDVKKANAMQKPPKVKIYQIPKASADNQQYEPSEENSTGSNLSKCEAQKRAYEESLACFNRCRLQNGYVNNVAACTRCQDVKKPNGN